MQSSDGKMILVFGASGTGKTTSIKYQGGKVLIKEGAQSDTDKVKVHTLANNYKAIDMPGLQDTRAIDEENDQHSDEATLRMLLQFFAEHKIDTIHGVEWHRNDTKRTSPELKREASFIHGLVGMEGWRNVVVIISEITVRDAHVAPMREEVQRLSGGFLPPIKGLKLDEHSSSTGSITFVQKDSLHNARIMSDLRLSHSPIQVGLVCFGYR